MEGEPTAEERWNSRLQWSIPPPPLCGASCSPIPSRIIGWPPVSSRTTGQALGVKARALIAGWQ